MISNLKLIEAAVVIQKYKLLSLKEIKSIMLAFDMISRRFASNSIPLYEDKSMKVFH